MKMNSRAFVLCALVLAGTATAQADDVCSKDQFVIDGTPVAATLCAPAQAKPANAPIAVTATFSSKTAAFSKTLTLGVVPGEAQSRAVEEVSLEPLGSPKSLYITVTYAGGKPALAHAVLLPGAITLK